MKIFNHYFYSTKPSLRSSCMRNRTLSGRHGIEIFLFMMLVFSSTMHSQVFSLKGNVSTDKTRVRYASITFTDENDTSKTFSALTDSSGNYQLSIVTKVSPQPVVVPRSMELEQNYPNPFSTTTTISYELNKPLDVSIKIFNILGQEVKSFRTELQQTGVHGIIWEGRNNFGEKVVPGVYFYQLISGEGSWAKKMLFGSGNGDNGGSVLVNRAEFLNKEAEDVKKLSFVSGNYTVKIENTDSTSPPVEAKQFINIVMQNDTTINFIVNEANDLALCYDKGYNGYGHIFFNNLKGTHPTNISDYSFTEQYPQWSPDGKCIVYQRSVSIYGPLTIVYDVKNKTYTDLTSDGGVSASLPQWTAKGKVYFAYQRPIGNSTATYMMNSDGSDKKKILDTVAAIYFYQDSYTFLYVSGTNVYKTDIYGTFNEFIVNLQPSTNQYLTIRDFNSLTGELLVNTNTISGSSSAIATFSAETKELKLIASAQKGYTLAMQRYSKDFSKIVFLEVDSSGYHSDFLSVLQSEGKKRLLNFTGNEWLSYSPMQFSYDGRYVAFSTVIYQGSWEPHLYVVEISSAAVHYIDEGDSATWNSEE